MEGMKEPTIMSSEDFQRRKKQVLEGVDLSRKGSIDTPILELVNFINDRIQFVTTSSCSGRAVLFVEDLSTGSRKKGCNWLYVTHKMVEENDLILKLLDASGLQGTIVLKYEPLILHIQCHTLEDAKAMHTCALESGFRNSGLTVGKRGKVMLAVRGTLTLEVPLSENCSSLVSNAYITFLVKKVNGKMKENEIRTQQFFTKLKSNFGEVCR